MTDKDRQLINQASRLNPVLWCDITDMIRQADTQEAKDELARIQRWKYHREEAMAGCI